MDVCSQLKTEITMSGAVRALRAPTEVDGIVKGCIATIQT